MPSPRVLSTLARFAQAVDRPEASLDLAEAALLLALDRFPDLRVDDYLARLDALARPLAGRVEPKGSLLRTVEALNGHLFGDEGFRGNDQDYYDPRNSYLNEVLDRRVGIPITLSVVYMEVARRIGLEVVGIGLPGHFIVEARQAADTLLLDPFHGGEVLDLEACERLVEEVHGGSLRFSEDLLVPWSKRAILVRMLTNLKMIYLREGDAEHAWPVTEKLVHLLPESPLERRDRGLLAHRLNRFAVARDDLRFYLDHAASASDVPAVRASLRAVEAILALTGPSS